MASIIEAQELTRHFGDLVAVDHVSFAVEQGEVFGFLGPNGAGKTTTVRMLTSVLSPTSGTATVEDHDIRTDSLGAREHMGIVPEEANVYLDLSVWRNVMLMGELHGVPGTRRRQEGNRLLDQLGLADRKQQKARALSKGLRQRLMLCSALVGGPEILFLDEPTSGLDVHSARLMREIVRDMNERGLTVFLTTHNMAEAEEMCDRVAIINQGKIAAIDTPDQLRDAMESSQHVLVSFQGAGPDRSELGSIQGVEKITEDGKGYRLYSEHPGRTVTRLAAFCERSGLTIAEIATCKPNLEDVFLHLTGQQATEQEQ